MAHFAWTDSKGSVSIEVGTCGATENSNNGEIMTDHDNGGIGALRLDNAVHPIPCSFRDIDEPLASGDKKFRGFRAPPRNKVRIGGADLGKSQSFELSVVELAKVVFDVYGQPMRSADDLGRLDSPLQVA